MWTMDVDSLLAELKDMLRQEIDLHTALRDDLAFEAEHDGGLDSMTMLNLQQRKYHLVSRIEGVENRRISKVRELARGWNEPLDGMTLKKIIGRVDSAQAKELQACHEGLLALVESIRRLARETGANAQARLKAVEATLSVIGEAARVHPTYSEEGRLQQRPPSFKSTSA
jgi:hypothetical protein